VAQYSQESILGLICGFSTVPRLDQSSFDTLSFGDVTSGTRNRLDDAVRRDYGTKNVFVMPIRAGRTGVCRFIGKPLSACKDLLNLVLKFGR
jgi:hypothetical protein